MRKVRREAEALVPAMRDAAGVDAAGRSRLAVFTGRGKTLREQMEAFANAEVVIGPYGAGMLNLMWAPEGCAVIIFHLDPPIDAVYAHTAVAIGHELWTVPTASSYYYGFYELDEAAVADVAATLRTCSRCAACARRRRSRRAVRSRRRSRRPRSTPTSARSTNGVGSAFDFS